jgi:hypothetical protein
VGNGNSNSLYKPQSTYCIGCNIPQQQFAYNSLSIIDNRPLDWIKQHGWQPPVPIFCTQEVKQRAKKFNISGDWFDVYERKHRWNAGHHAVLYHSKMTSEIHLWGFDSLFSQDLTSQTDAIIPRHTRPPLNNHWHPIWLEILEQIDCRVVLHIPKGAKCAIKHDKIHTQQHGTEDLAVSTDYA